MSSKFALFCSACKTYIPITQWLGNSIDYVKCPLCETEYSDAKEFHVIGKPPKLPLAARGSHE